MFSAPIPDDDAIRLATLERYQVLDSAPEPGYEDVTALASYLCDTPFSTITLVDRDRQWFKSEVGFGTRQTNRADGFCACALLAHHTLIVQDTLDDPRFAENPFVLGGPRIRFYAGAPLIAPNGQVLGTVCVFDTRPRTLEPRQIAALESLARQVMALLDARLLLIESSRNAAALMQTEKLAAVGRLASSMAHEINNPLEAITNLLYLSRMQSTDPDVGEWLGMAEQELRRVSVIANQALRFHKQSTSPQEITCTSLFSHTLEIYQARLTNSRIQIEKRKRADEPVLCFEGDIRQVLSAVIANAIDAMPTGGRLLVRSRKGRQWSTGRRGLVLTLADTGTGIAPEVQPRLFEAFFSTKGIGGTGLGLWISEDILRRHDGRIQIRSRASSPSGTVVVIFLPYRTIPEPFELPLHGPPPGMVC